MVLAKRDVPSLLLLFYLAVTKKRVLDDVLEYLLQLVKR